MKRLIEAWRAAARRRAAIRELEGYDDLQLRDLGITRAEIRAYVDGTHNKARMTGVVIPFPDRSPRAVLCQPCRPGCCQDAA